MTLTTSALSAFGSRRSVCILLFVLGLMLLVLQPLHAGPIHPPLQTLRNGHFTLVSGVAGSYDSETRTLAFAKVEKLRGPVAVDEQIEVHMPAEVAASLKPGNRYLLVYSDARRDSTQPRRFVRTQRKAIVHTDGADPALFLDTPALRALLAETHREIEQSEDYVKTIRQGLRQDDPKLVDLWLAEYVHRPGTFSAPSAADRRRFRQIAEDRTQLAGARARILLATIDRGEGWAGDWLAPAAYDVLAGTTPAALEKAPDQRQLIYAALLVAKTLPTASRSRDLLPWLGADDALAELAVEALLAINPDLARSSLLAVLEQGSTPAATERMIRRRLARLPE